MAERRMLKQKQNRKRWEYDVEQSLKFTRRMWLKKHFGGSRMQGEYRLAKLFGFRSFTAFMLADFNKDTVVKDRVVDCRRALVD